MAKKRKSTKNATCETCKKRYLRTYVTAIQYGTKCQVVIKCASCGYVDDITDLVNQVPKHYINDLLHNTQVK